MNDRKKTIFIVGLSSMVGSNLAEILKNRYRVIGSYHKNPIEIDGVLSVQCDITDKEQVRRVMYLFKPDFTIYAAGLTSLEDCQNDPQLSDSLNTGGIFHVTSATERYNSRFIYISSSYIFSGEKKCFLEHDSPTPSSVYGNSVTSAEFYIQKSCLNYMILRCSPFIGRTFHPQDLSFTEYLDKNNMFNRKIICDSVVYNGYLDFYTLAQVVDRAIRRGVINKVYNVTTMNMMNRYELAYEYMQEFNMNTNLLVKGEWGFPRTENKLALQNLGEELFFELDTKLIERELDFKPPSIKEVVKRFKMSVEKNIEVKDRKKTDGINFI